MATLTRSNSRATPPVYKDYVNFLAGYKNGKKDENQDSDSSGSSVRNFPLSNSSNSTSSSSSTSDVTDFSKNTCTPYNTFLENSKTKKFTSVKPNFDEKTEKTTMKSEIFIEIEPARSVSVSEVSKIFENNDRKSTKSNKINSKVSIFEKQVSTESKPKLATKPVIFKTTQPPKVVVESLEVLQPSKIEEPTPAKTEEVKVLPPPPPPMPSSIQAPKQLKAIINNPPPPAPVMSCQPPKIQATLNKGPQTTYSVSNPNGTIEIDRNDPLVRKLVYGTLRGLYGAYHDKASDMLATLPKNMVVRSNGVQDRIEQIAANGDLDKLNGRVNPKLEQE